MGAFDLFWNLTQEERIEHLLKRVEKLEEQNKILYEWVQYLRKQGEKK